MESAIIFWSSSRINDYHLWLLNFSIVGGLHPMNWETLFGRRKLRMLCSSIEHTQWSPTVILLTWIFFLKCTILRYNFKYTEDRSTVIQTDAASTLALCTAIVKFACWNSTSTAFDGCIRYQHAQNTVRYSLCIARQHAFQFYFEYKAQGSAFFFLLVQSHAKLVHLGWLWSKTSTHL